MRRLSAWLAALALALAVSAPAPAQENAPMKPDDDAPPAPSVYDLRDEDWRNGAVVYQVIADRFAPAADLDAKRHLYPAPKKLRDWDETPARGEFVPEARVWSHEIDFWGGDLASVQGRLDHVADLGADVLYLNPIHDAYTNHKYDARDWFAISPEYGTRDDFRALAEAAHEKGLKLVVDGVFNHMGSQSPAFREAMADPGSPWREWFFIGSEYKLGYRAWANVPNLPEVNLESPAVRARIYGDPDSAVQGYLRDGADGWRLDVAFDIGPEYLGGLTRAAHQAKPGSLVSGEIWNYPERWFPAVDSVMNFHVRQMTFFLLEGEISGAKFGRFFERMVQDAGIEPILKSWLVIDNHDTPRLATSAPQPWKRRMARTLQFTLPGSPCLYYGAEVGMEGGDDPENRAPMRWDLVEEGNETLAFTRRLLDLRRECRALRVGGFRLMDSDSLLAFARVTDKAAETVLVIANPSDEAVSEVLQPRDSWLMNFGGLRDALGGEARAEVLAGLIRVEIPARAVWVLRPDVGTPPDYTPYKRVP